MRRIASKKPDPTAVAEAHTRAQQIKLTQAIETIRDIREELGGTNDPTAPLVDQLFHWHRVRQFYDAVKALANEAETLSRYMSYEQLPQAFRASRVNARAVTLDGIGRFALSSRTTAKVTNQDNANDFLDQHDKGDAIRRMVPASTLNSIVAELIKTGVEPDRERDGIEANTYAYTSFTKE
jgi:hypothetical protein